MGIKWDNIWVLGTMVRASQFENESFIPPAAGHAARKQTSVVSPLWGIVSAADICLGQGHMPFRGQPVLMTDQWRSMKAWRPCPHSGNSGGPFQLQSFLWGWLTLCPTLLPALLFPRCWSQDTPSSFGNTLCLLSQQKQRATHYKVLRKVPGT